MLAKKLLSGLSVLMFFGLYSCEAVKDTLGVANRPPVIASFDYNPKSGLTKNDIITFSIVSNDPEGKPLQYNWTATKGFLTGNAGTTVSWRAVNQNNAFEPGLSTVSVIISDGIMTTTASVNIYLSPEGTITVNGNPSPSSSPSSATPTATPVQSLSPTATATPSATPLPTPTVVSTPVASTSPTVLPTASATPVQSVLPTASATPSTTSSSAVLVQQQ